MSDDERIVTYCKDRFKTPIVEIYNNYVILTNSSHDLKSKQASIDRGQTLGFYIRQRILDVINNEQNEL